jgi:pimeloyl-ACP methyl ester carboxylesterase
MSCHLVVFRRALGLKTFDMVGFSLGGMIAQQLAAEHPDIVRRITCSARAHADRSRKGRYLVLGKICQPTLIVHGNKDVIVMPINAVILGQHIPDASHGAQSQYAEEFLEHARRFLNDRTTLRSLKITHTVHDVAHSLSWRQGARPARKGYARPWEELRTGAIEANRYRPRCSASRWRYS